MLFFEEYKICPFKSCNSTNIDTWFEEYHHVAFCKSCARSFYKLYRPEKRCCDKPNIVDVVQNLDSFNIKTGHPHTRIYEQCWNCGCGFKRQPKKSKDADIHGEYDESRHQEWQDRKNELGSILYKQQQENNNFANYYYSSKWRDKRKLVLARDNNKCIECGEPATDVHHLTYKHFRNEPLEDLASLCFKCHSDKHEHMKIEIEEKASE